MPSSPRRIDFAIPAKATALECRCGAPIVFAATSHGKRIPLDLRTVEERGGKRYAESHFATCPEAARFRRPKIQGAKRRKP